MNLRDDPACIHHFRNRGNENQKEEVTWERVHSYSGPLSTLKKKKKSQVSRLSEQCSCRVHFGAFQNNYHHSQFCSLGKSFKTGGKLNPLHFIQVLEGDSQVTVD